MSASAMGPMASTACDVGGGVADVLTEVQTDTWVCGVCNFVVEVLALQGYLAYKKPPHPSTLQQVYV